MIYLRNKKMTCIRCHRHHPRFDIPNKSHFGVYLIKIFHEIRKKWKYLHYHWNRWWAVQLGSNVGKAQSTITCYIDTMERQQENNNRFENKNMTLEHTVFSCKREKHQQQTTKSEWKKKTDLDELKPHYQFITSI